MYCTNDMMNKPSDRQHITVNNKTIRQTWSHRVLRYNINMT